MARSHLRVGSSLRSNPGPTAIQRRIAGQIEPSSTSLVPNAKEVFLKRPKIFLKMAPCISGGAFDVGRKEPPVDPGLDKALSHPVRVEILEVLKVGKASPEQLATSLSGNVPRIGYHLQVLRGAGCIRPAGTKRGAGGSEQLYEITSLAEESG